MCTEVPLNSKRRKSLGEKRGGNCIISESLKLKEQSDLNLQRYSDFHLYNISLEGDG